MAKVKITAEQLKEVVAAIWAEYMDVIMHHDVTPHINMNTDEIDGLQVVLLLSTAYHYGNEIFDRWRRLLHADNWYINVCRNQLYIHFIVLQKEE